MKGAVWVMVVAITVWPILQGCADKEAMTEYYQVEAARTAAIVASIESQQKANSHNRTLQMQSFSTAATTAAVTDSPVDDALLAFAWGYALGTPQHIEIPKLQPIKAPDSSADMIRAWTPIVGMAMPFLYPLAYGWASGSGGTSISADNGANVMVDSGNPGSYNSAGGDLASTPTTTDSFNVENCDGCDSGGTEGGPGTDVDPTNPIVGGETCDVTGGYLGPDGRIYADPGFTCSCGSRAEGAC